MQLKTKFKLMDMLYYLKDSIIVQGIVHGIDVRLTSQGQDTRYWIGPEKDCIQEKFLFKTKNALTNDLLKESAKP
jgi:hypothetical protein